MFNFYPILATAVDTSQNLFSEEWTEGDLYSIQGVVNWLGDKAVVVISFVGFAIVIFSILKNALSGLYVVNPNFWDRVDEIKNQAVAGVSGTITDATNRTGNVAAQKLGGVFTFILSIIPNVKALTDFDENAEVDKKQYFTKSLILLVAQIFIGMLIFFGYPAKIANWIGSGATYAISAVLNNVDPVTVVAGLSDSFTTYNLATDDSQDVWEQNINEMASSMVRTMATKYTDMSKANIQNVAYVIEDNLLSAFSDSAIKTVLGASEGYDYATSAIIMESTPSVSDSFKTVADNVYMSQSSNGTITYRYWISCSSILANGQTVADLSDHYMVWTVTATPVAVSNVSTANLIVCGGISTTPSVSGDTFALTIQGITVGQADSDVQGTPGKVVTVEVIDTSSTDSDGNATGSVVATYNATLQTASVKQTSGSTMSLSFASSYRDTIKNYLTDSKYYLRVNLVGDWTKTVAGTTSTSSTTVRVTQFRLVGNATSASYLLSTWTDLTNATCTGVSSLTTDTLKQSSSSGS